MLGMIGSRRIVHTMTSINTIHRKGVHERQNDKNIDGSLLSEPKAQRETAEVKLVKRLNEDNTEKIGNNKPKEKKHNHQTKVFMPMRMSGSIGTSALEVVWWR